MSVMITGFETVAIMECRAMSGTLLLTSWPKQQSQVTHSVMNGWLEMYRGICGKSDGRRGMAKLS